MKNYATLFSLLIVFLMDLTINAQIDFEKYEPMPLPSRSLLVDSSITSNQQIKFNAEKQYQVITYEDPQTTILDHLPPNTFARIAEETMLESRQFNGLVAADQIGVLTDYPIRTVVKLNITMYNPSTNQTNNVSCSGIMVGDNEVLTAGHCVAAGGTDPSYATAITVIPAYNMGSTPFGSAQMTEWLSFTQWTNNGNWDYDIAMLKLDQAIGNTVGWLSFGYNMNNAFFTNQANTFHSFGYPAQNDAGQTVFEGGERMYYMNGFLDYFESANSMAHYNIGFHGQSGSGLYFNDAGSRIVCGVLSHGSNQIPNTVHTRIDEWMFNYFVDFYDFPQVSVEENTNQELLVSVAPNPSETGIFSLQFGNQLKAHVEITNSNGQIIQSIDNVDQNTLQVDLSEFASGIYYCSATLNGENVRLKLMKL